MPIGGPPADPQERREQFRRWRRWLLALLLLALVADTAWVLIRLPNHLQSAASSFRQARETIEQGDLQGAQVLLVDALKSSNKAQDLTGHPPLLLASLIPPLDRDADAVDKLSRAAELSARAGLSAIEGAREAGASGANPLTAVYQNGRVQLEAIKAAETSLDDTLNLLSDAQSLLRRVGEPSIDRIADGVLVARREIENAIGSVEAGALVADFLPDFLGDETPRKYFLAFQTPSEARGGGGLLGFYGILTADDGRIRLSHLAPVQELIALPKIKIKSPTKWFSDRYRGVFGLRQWQQVNFSPEFPVTAEVWLRLYEARAGEALDGAIEIDPLALESLLPATGPIQAGGWDVEVTEDNAADLILNRSYSELDEPAQNVWLGNLIDEFWGRLNGGSVDGALLANGIAEAAGTHHLKIYSRDKDQQKTLRQMNADGSYTWVGPNLQLVFNNNAGPNKLDYFLTRKVHTTVKIDDTGRARFETEVILHNASPKSGSTIQIGPNSVDIEAGENRMYIDMLTPVGALFRSFQLDGEVARLFLEHEAGYPAFWRILKIPPGDTQTLNLKYDIPDMVLLGEGGGTLDMTFFPQTTVNPDELIFEVIPPDGFVTREVGGEPAERFFESRVLDREHNVRVQIIPEGNV